jgi:thioredoxin-related protein/YHS domain-containing protein
MNTPLLNCRFGLLVLLPAVFSVCFLPISGFAQGFGYQPTTSLRWETDMNTAMARAERENRPLFVHFVGNDCIPAQQMENEVFVQPNIAAHLQANYVMVKINASENTALAQKFAVTSIPTDLILHPNGQQIHRRTGGIPAEKFGEYLAYLQTLQPDKVPPPPAPTAVAPLQTANPAGLPNPTPAPSGFAPPREMTPMSDALRDPFAPQLLNTQQQPGAMGTTLPPVNNPNNPNLLRTGETAARPAMETNNVPNPNVPNPYGGMPNQSQPPVSIPPITAPPAVSTVSVIAAMLEEPAPAKMMVAVPLALEGFCPVTLCKETRWVTGNPAYSTMYQGHIFHFSSADALAVFARNPASYAPVAMGEDIVVMADKNRRVNGSRKFGLCYEDRVFLFSSQESYDAFEARPGYYADIALKYELARREQSSPILY